MTHALLALVEEVGYKALNDVAPELRNDSDILLGVLLCDFSCYRNHEIIEILSHYAGQSRDDMARFAKPAYDGLVR